MIKKDKRLSVYLTTSNHEKLNEQSKSTGVSKSSLINLAISKEFGLGSQFFIDSVANAMTKKKSNKKK